MASRRTSKKSTSAASTRLLVIDAGLAAGWRRATPDLDQLDDIVAAARSVVPEPVVMADAALKWSLPADQQDRFEEYRATSRVLCAPGGTKGGHHAFLAAAAQLGAEKGRDVWVLTGLDLGNGPWHLARLRKPDGQWEIEFPS